MTDIRLISILSPPLVQGALPNQPSAGGASPGFLVGMPVGSILSGFIVNRDPQGNPILRTDQADIVFASNFFLKIGSEVVIRVENRAGQTQAHILSVNGQPPEIAETQSAFAGEPEVIVGNTPHPAQRPIAPHAADTISARPTAPGATVTATVIAPPATSIPAPPPVPTGAALTLKIIQVTPAAEGMPAPIIAQAAQQPAATPPNPLYAAYARPSVAPAPAAPSPPIIPAIPPIGGQIAATVIAHEPSGEAIIHTPLGIMRLQPGTVLPPGSSVTFELTRLVNNPLPPADINEAPMPELMHQWESLRQITSLLSGRVFSGEAPPVFPGLLAAGSPASPAPMPTPQGLTAGLLVFVSALRGGDFRNWLGRDNIHWLESQGHAALVKHAEGDFATLARTFNEPAPPGQWQSLFFPVMVNGELQQVRMFTKRDKKKDNKTGARAGDDTRFVLELDLSQMGAMQMDGFVRKRERDLQFDLVIRSHVPLEDNMQRQILAIYNNTGELTGYHGSLVFQAVREFPVNPLQELNSGSHEGLMV